MEQLNTDEVRPLQLSCVARAQGRNVRSSRSKQSDEPQALQSWLRSAQFTADGSCLVAHSDDSKLHTFALTAAILESKEPAILTPNASCTSPSTLLSYAIHPGFNQQDTSTTWVAAGHTDLPIQLRNAVDYDFALYNYPWQHPNTEAFRGANSLAFLHDEKQFIAGTRACIGLFDIERVGEQPVVSHHIKTGLNKRDKGLVMALAVSSSGTLALGTSNRNIALWDASVQGNSTLSFSLAPGRALRDDCPGNGVTSMAWSACERYLFVAERQSGCIQIFDVRYGGHRVSWLSSRAAMTTQKIEFSTIPTPNGFELWSGGMDGTMRMWNNPGSVENEHAPTFESKLCEYSIGSTSWQPQGAIMATCAGGYPSESPSDDIHAGQSLDTLSIWTVT